MDSGNSGSMQSSSSGTGGADNDQEFDSRAADSISSLFNPSTTYPTSSFPGFDNPPSLQLYPLRFNNGSSSSTMAFDHHQQQASNCFGSIGNDNNLMAMNNSNNNCANMAWPNKFGPIKSHSEDANFHPGPVGRRSNNNNNNGHLVSTTAAAAAHDLQQRPVAASAPPVRGGGGPSMDQGQSQGNGSGRNPKKRSRASRRAPTTVLTTDTSNFRQMVQEFTGIPSPPFSGASFPTRTRLDLFGFGSMGMGMGTNLPRPGSSSAPLLRPFAQKLAANNPLSMISGPPSSSADRSTPISAANFQMSQNFFTFQSLLQSSSSTPTADLGSGHGTAATTDGPAAVTVGSGNPGGGLEPRSERVSDHSSWAAALHQGLGLGSQGDQTRCSGDQVAGGNYGSINVNATSENHGGGNARAEGMLDSWICSSD